MKKPRRGKRKNLEIGSGKNRHRPHNRKPSTIWKNVTGAIEGTRTPTPLRVHGPEPCASANSATMASGLTLQRRPQKAAVRKTNFSILQSDCELSNLRGNRVVPQFEFNRFCEATSLRAKRQRRVPHSRATRQSLPR